MGEHTVNALKLMVQILEESDVDLTSREIYGKLLDTGIKRLPTYRQVANLLAHHPSKFTMVRKGEGTSRQKRIRWWRKNHE